MIKVIVSGTLPAGFVTDRVIVSFKKIPTTLKSKCAPLNKCLSREISKNYLVGIIRGLLRCVLPEYYINGNNLKQVPLRQTTGMNLYSVEKF